MSSEAAPFGSCPRPLTSLAEVQLAHGSGGRLTAQLVEHLFVPAFDNPALAALDDQAVLPLEGGGRLAFTTDSYVVSPIVFPGGDIAELAINGTVNDLVVGGARPLGLSLAFILEEGLPLSQLEALVASAARAAARAGVPIVTGDTKVVGRGHGDKIFVNTSGVGQVPAGVELGSRRVRAGDAVVISGTIGDHGIAVMAAREGLALEGELVSDTAPLGGLVAEVLRACPDTHAMRDPTRGGLAATLVEIAARQRLGISLDETAVPVRDTVRGACELLGLDPLLVANEGKLVAFVPPEHAPAVVDAMRAHPLGRQAVCIGKVTEENSGLVVARTAVGGLRIVDLPYGEQLPRIC
jgi:hydrogenase expression/formation protein HypE